MQENLELIRARADAVVAHHTKLMRDLIAMRTKHNLSQEAIAERMGVSQPTVSEFERYDSNPTLATIRRYAVAVGARFEGGVIDDCAAHVSISISTKELELMWGTVSTPTHWTWKPQWTALESPLRTERVAG